jgi:hypothetical protein
MASPAAVRGQQQLHAGEGLAGELEYRACSRARECPEADAINPHYHQQQVRLQY